MAISRKTFTTVKEILRELDQQRSAARRPAPGEPGTPTTARATPKRSDGGLDAPGRDRAAGAGRDGSGEQLIG